MTLLSIGLCAFAQETEGIDTDLSCETCHSGSDWTSDIGQSFDHIMTGFELKGSHADIDCGRCHTGSTPAEKHNFGRLSPECQGCHEDIHQDQWGQDCERCHNTDSWVLSTQQQNHDLTNFPLQGPHRSLSCETCHLNNPGSSNTLPLDCYGCHSEQYMTSSNPSHSRLVLNTDCEQCHPSTAPAWSPSNFDHNDTKYYLLGMHNTVSCESCHTQNANDTPKSCEGCHMQDYVNSLDPPHESDGFPTHCMSCHDSFTWNTTWVHDRTGFLLEEAHLEIPCSDCHPDQTFDDLPETCFGCHETQWNESAAPPHDDAEFGEECSDCHTSTAWTPSLWDHDTDSDYPLTGAHIEASCDLCHTTIPYSEQASECVDCHQTDYDESLEPNHITSGIPTTCDICHTTENWDSEEIDHSKTDFPLVGAHLEVECMVCHEDGYELPTLCEGCHLSEYQSTSTTNSPDHTQFGFSTDCLVCHAQTTWLPSRFDHDPELTGYEVMGAHLELLPDNCEACHESSQWTGISQDCAVCHQSNFINTQDPDHQDNGYPDNLCESCHSQDAWEPSIFAHTATSIACVSCHMIQYTGTVDPPHETLAFPQDCESCHSTTAWSPSSFIHNVEATGFLVDGAHTDIACSSCHDTWEAPVEVRGCAASSCHEDNFNDSTDPPHETMGFSTTCTDCHTTTAWSPSSFAHDLETTGYALEEAHITASCQQCHTPWQIVETPRTCADGSCHLPDYQSATDPNHASASYPLDCESCHSMTAWEPSTFDHDGQFFPIYSGQHRGEWNDCSQCHINNNDYGVYTCFGGGCHEINDMNNEHCEGADCETCNGITYPQFGVVPEQCYTCHPTGDEDDCGGDILNFFKMRTLPRPHEKRPNATN